MHRAALLSLRLPAFLAAVAISASACSDRAAPLAPELPDGAVAARSAALGPASAPAPSPAAAHYEIDFMTDMIDHHHMAIMMSEMCLEKAVHEELRALCEQIIAAQQAEIALMQGWLQGWYGISYAPQMKPGDERMMEKLAALSPEEFEIAFMEMMIKHHAKAVKEGEHCLERAYHEELRQLCENIIATQTEEIALMQAWLCAWYGICR